MKESLKEGLTFEFRYTVPENKTVPYLYTEAEEFQVMSRVFATGFMVGLFKWACIRAIKPYLNYPQEQTVGIHVNFSHTAATPPGLTITVRGRLDKIRGRKLSFSIEAHDGIEKISEGAHDRFIIYSEKFNRKVEEKKRVSKTP
ncbi:MAG TPA: thioesterase family protein [Thermodesulfovibrionales bacterium]|jgi:fluoroacetyl-CoA thioesterase|nr:thioesterase family protein [Thermodesulfovibrionales bacterium]